MTRQQGVSTTLESRREPGTDITLDLSNEGLHNQGLLDHSNRLPSLDVFRSCSQRLKIL